MVLHRLLLEDFDEWNKKCEEYELRNRNLKVPVVNDTTTLHQFNCELNDLYAEVEFLYGRARRNKDAIERLIENVLKNYYKGPNELARKAAGIQYAQNFPVPESAKPYYPTDKVNLFDLEDQFNGYYTSLNSNIKILKAKGEAKITNNSLLNLERNLIPN